MLTPADVTAGFATTVPDAEIQELIDFMGMADDCLTANDVPEATQDLLKKYAIRHLITLQNNGGRGQVTSESAPSGAARSFGRWTQGKGLEASSYGSILKQMDRYGCVRAVLENDQNLVAFVAAPKRCKRRGFR